MELEVKLESFEGPLDLLLHLLDKNKISIYDIPIIEITKQYLEYIRKMEENDLNIMSEFLVMAATLIDIKSRMLLPSDDSEEEEEDPRAELIQQLIEYKLYKSMSFELRDRQMEADKMIFRDPSVPEEVSSYEQPVDISELMSGLTLSRLNDIFKMVIRKQENKIDKVRAGFGRIEKEEVSLTERMEYLEAYAREFKVFGFRQLLESQSSKMKVVVTFLAVLELIKTGRIQIVQETLFDEITIELKSA